MTLPQFGPSYKTFRTSELRSSIRNRGIKTPTKDRRRMIQDLTREDHDARFRFLDLPPELRNHIYTTLLMIRPNIYDGTATSLYPSILATCRQVNKEGTGFLYSTTHAEITMRLQQRQFEDEDDMDSEPFEYDLCVSFNSVKLAIDKDQLKGTFVTWPRLLCKMRSIKLTLDLPKLKAPDHTSMRVEQIDLNQALNSLYKQLFERRDVEMLEVQATSDPASDGFHLRKVLSPMCALAGKIQNSSSNLINFSADLGAEIRAAAAAFSTHFLMEGEVKLHNRIHRKLFDRSWYDTRGYYYMVQPGSHGDLCIFADSVEVNRLITDCEQEFVETLDEELADPTSPVRKEVLRLQKMRIARKKREKEQQQE